ncbi:polygalacturonase ADPG2 [Lactuca sativa]|uniref:polygalacturonase ADPG2 n=1 Tax=Lactuca sativa TaxID=4236 RepID=UPI000CD9C905|nr:polygalacturonase ADPG2 [Lactuca sativa]
MKKNMFPLMLLLGLVSGIVAWPIDEFNVFNYGASGFGEVDDSKAFVNAWRDACNVGTHDARVIVPKGTFLLNPLMFVGPCNPQIIRFVIFGKIIAPGEPEAWNGRDSSQWIAFKNVTGLNLYGSGLIDGHGMRWWDQSCRYHPELEGCTKLAPTIFKFISCKESTLRDIHLVNSPQTHVLIQYSNGFNVDNVTIQSPEHSPNTDGIHIHSSHFVKITNSIIGTGDDCISIGDYISNIDIADIHCGPGHGISIGSLGKNREVVHVEHIHIRDSTLKGTSNGARIKTWQGGQGNVRNITFENLEFDAVKNPIIIDQNYCDVRGRCKEEETGVKISDVIYKHLYGTSSTKIAINLNCSKSVPCSRITMDNINLVSVQQGYPVTANCTNAKGTEVEVNPGPCLRN